MRSFVFVIFFLFISSVYAETFYIDPENGDISNDGSQGSPWSTLQEVFESDMIETRECSPLPCQDTYVLKNLGAEIKAGDTLVLMDGYHGKLTTSNANQFYNTENITVIAGNGQVPELGQLNMRASSGWHFIGLSISPSHASTYEKPSNLVSFENHGHQGRSFDCTIENSTLFSVWDTSSWTESDWNNLPPNGISLSGDHTRAIGNYVKNINFGIVGSGDYVLVRQNTVENFAGDGMRGLGDYGVYEYNTVKNCYDVNSNHDDGFQSWSRSDEGVGQGVVYGIVLRGNMIINYEDEDQPFKGTLQGIGCFDGMFEDWLVVDNIVMTDHWHGITLSGATNCHIVNNTVIDLNDERPGPAWVRIGNHKDGRLSTGCSIENNIVTSINAAEQVTLLDNLEIEFSEYDSTFEDWQEYDLIPVSGDCSVGSHVPCGEICLDCLTPTRDCTVEIMSLIFDLFSGSANISDIMQEIIKWKTCN